MSFDQETVFSMLAATGDEHSNHLVRDTPRKGDSVLRAAALYGANGAGKTSLVRAIAVAQNLILDGTRAGHTIPVIPFKLGLDTDRPTKFEFTFQTSGISYNYGFRADETRIIEEWLFETPKSRELLLFQRTTSDQGNVDVEFGATLTGGISKNKRFLDFVAQGTRPNQLFLTEAHERNVSRVLPVTAWFDNVLVVVPAEASANALEPGLLMFRPNIDFILTLLRDAGTGIDHIDTVEEPFDFDRLMPQITSDNKTAILKEVASLGPTDALGVSGLNGRRFFLLRGGDGGPIRLAMDLHHRTADGRLVRFDIEDESEGTGRLINLLPALLMLKTQPEKVVVLDELDRRFHTLLSRAFVQSALDCDSEHRQSQLIFTTHDTNLLDLDLLRRDEIWFVEKDRGGASHLSSLAEYKVRTDLKIEKGYLNGRFGAIPFSGEPSQLGWALNDKPGEIGSGSELSSVA